MFAVVDASEAVVEERSDDVGEIAKGEGLELGWDVDEAELGGLGEDLLYCLVAELFGEVGHFQH